MEKQAMQSFPRVLDLENARLDGLETSPRSPTWPPDSP